MKLSYTMRRNDTLENGHKFSILEKYPFLQSPEHVRYKNLNLNFMCINCKLIYADDG